MKKRSILCIVLAVMLVFGLTACSSSGSSAEVGAANAEEDSAASEAEQEMGKNDDTEEADSVSNLDDAEKAARLEELKRKTNVDGYSEEQKQECFKSIAEAIKSEYLEPNGIAPEDFVWPEYYITETSMGERIVDEDLAWTYFLGIWMNYGVYGTMYDTSDVKVLPEKEETKQLMNAVLDGIVTWYNRPENVTGYRYHPEEFLSPFEEVIPANVHLID